MFVHICDLQMRKEGITLFGEMARLPNKASKSGFHFWKDRSVFVHVMTQFPFLERGPDSKLRQI